MRKYTNFKTLNPNAHPPNAQQHDQTPRGGDAMLDLDSCSETELKELKHKFLSDVARIRSFVKQIEYAVDKRSKKRPMPMAPDRENKRKTVELDSAAMMRKCGVILDKLMKHRHGWVFNKPVDVVALRLQDYYKVVKRPMDLGTIKLKLDKRAYRTPLDFANDVRLTFDNAMLYNRKGEDVYIMAAVLLEMFDKLFDPAYEEYEALCNAAPAVKTLGVAKILVSELKANPPMRKDIEIEKLGLVLQDLAGEYLDEILQIVAKRNPRMMTPDGDGEIELDVHALDSATIWDLHRFVMLHPKAGQNDKAI